MKPVLPVLTSVTTILSWPSQGINNILLWQGEVFSFNEVVRPRTVERGYMPAPVILMGSTSLDYGEECARFPAPYIMQF